MEFIINNKGVLAGLPALTPNGIEISSSSQPFIEANTEFMDVMEMKEKHIIPVWATTNEPLISHTEFVESMWETVHRAYPSEKILKPNIRVSHPIKGRIPEAKHKAAKDLEPWEQTIYYERMMFVIELPGISDEVNGNELCLTIGGVKSYNLDNLYSKRSYGVQHFQLFIGFQNKVCCNLCVWTDGLKEEVGVRSLSQLKYALQDLINNYRAGKHLNALRQMGDLSLNESEFAQIAGRARMFRHLPESVKKSVPELLLGDQQMSAVVGGYYHDLNFARTEGEDLSLWQFYNLLTGANKSSYIDSFLQRGVNAHDIAHSVLKHKRGEEVCWYMG